MFKLSQIDTRPSGYYAVPVDGSKSAYSFQPMANINRVVERAMEPKIFVLNGNGGGGGAGANKQRLMTVSGTGEVRMPPDRVKLVVIVSNTKENINEAKESVHKRQEYIYQTLRKHRVDVSGTGV